MRYLLIFIFTVLAIHASAQLTQRERTCIKQENLAKKDMYNKEMKFYSFGLVAAFTDRDILRDSVLKTYYHIEMIHGGCVPFEGFECYNSMVEKIAQRKYGKDFWQQVDNKTDSLMTIRTKQPR